MIPLTGTREMRTKPVTTVPTMAPAVPIPDNWPTTVPVSVEAGQPQLGHHRRHRRQQACRAR